VRSLAEPLPEAVAACAAAAADHGASYEIILIDDGDEATARQADHLAAAYGPVMVLHQPRPLGYAEALRAAWPFASGAYLVAIDLAGPVGIAEVPRLLAALGAGHAVLAAYRLGAGQGAATQLYAAAVRRALRTDLRDPALRLAIFRSDLADMLPPTTPDSLAHAEIYARAARAGLAVAQVGVAGRRRAIGPAALIELIRSRPPASPRQLGALAGSLAMGLAGGVWLLRRLAEYNERGRPTLDSARTRPAPKDAS
jgi:hypothetical protein